MKKCTVEGCEKPLLAKGFCSMHWERWRKHGDPLAGRTPNGRSERYLAEILQDIDSDKCRVWPFGVSVGYPWISSRRKHAHVLVCEHFHGPRPDGMEVCHNCNNRLCLNPRHLRWDTHRSNMEDLVSLIGHGANNKLTRKEVLEIRALYGTMTYEQLAKRYNVSIPTIGNIINRKTWNHVN